VVNASRPPELVELGDVLDQLGRPAIVTFDSLTSIQSNAAPDFVLWMRDRKNRRIIPRYLEANGYVAVSNPDAANGLWRVDGKKQVLYGDARLAPAAQISAARAL
jgi:hypothetical protein